MTTSQPTEAPHDREIWDEVLAELAWDPRLRPNEIEVHVQGGVVTLAGWVDSYMKRYAADRAAHRVPGVRSVTNQIEVRLPVTAERTDAEIAAAVAIALESNAGLEARNINVSVEDGLVTLEGAVEWNFQRDDAERVIRSLWGVRGVRNLITVRARAILAELKHEIRNALARTVETEGTKIDVDAQRGQVVLRGKARSWDRREAAEHVAWSAPGVTAVENEIVVEADATRRDRARR